MKNESNKSYIKFWGVRGSNPTPDKNKMKYGGDTSCVEIKTNENDLIILDMGTGIRNLGAKIISDESYGTEINIFLSHYHWDHIMGFFYFAPLYDKKFTINIYGYNAKTTIETLKDYLINKNFWPVDEETYEAKINFIELPKTSNEETLITINQTNIYYSLHPHPNGANSFRVETNNKKIVYITDCEHPDGKLNPNVINISNESDILIHDSHYTINDLSNHRGWGHSSWKQAAEVAIISRTNKLVLFHHSPSYDDNQIDENEKNAQKKFINTVAAYQGLSIDLD
tara:strand:- start:5268 stop:6119 length:852 start_codon:yes stop_codon:yes gene_type:complete